MVVLLRLGIEVHLHHFSNFLLVDRVHGETDGLPCNRGFIQGQEDCGPTGGACGVKIKVNGASDQVGFNIRRDLCWNFRLPLRNVESSDATELLESVEVGAE